MTLITRRCSAMTHGVRLVALLVVMLLPSGSLAMSAAQAPTAFPDLDAGQRVYDETGSSLTPEQIADLQRQIEGLRAIGADVIVYVRGFDASPDDTLDQVKALQQAWVATSGADQDTAVAILINRNPDDPNDARAGIFVGSTYDDGNVPRGEQRHIVDDALIPPLRDGDVYGSLTAGLSRLEDDIRNGPPPKARNAFERWSSDAAGSWLPWAGVGLAVAGLGAAWAAFSKRQTVERPAPVPTTDRPGTIAPALAGALTAGSPQASAASATLLDLATRGALEIEPEGEGGVFSRPKVQVRLVDGGLVSDDVEDVVWQQLESRAENGVVSSDDL